MLFSMSHVDTWEPEKKTGVAPTKKQKKKLCLHGKVAYWCCQCKGPGICEHGKQKHRCLLCGGSSLCGHDIRKEICKVCRGSAICQHGRLKQICKICGGSSICQHGRLRKTCKTCGGSSFCQHGRQKHRCKACEGSSICQHGRAKYVCGPCGGIGLCTHGQQKSRCKQCGGSQICQHGERKELCQPCGGYMYCSNCHYVLVGRRGDCCSSCLPRPSLRSKCHEIRLAGSLGQWVSDGKISNYTSWNKQNPLADPLQCGKYRVDFTFETPSGVVLLECDEKQHSEYVKRCELVRQAEVALGYGGLPVHWIRYNPDAFKINGTTRVTKQKERKSTLLRHLQLALTRPDYEHFITVTYICYDNPGTTNEDPDALVQRHVFKTVEDYNVWAEKTS